MLSIVFNKAKARTCTNTLAGNLLQNHINDLEHSASFGIIIIVKSSYHMLHGVFPWKQNKLVNFIIRDKIKITHFGRRAGYVKQTTVYFITIGKICGKFHNS